MTAIFDPSGAPGALVVGPGYLRTLAIQSSMMHTLAEVGKAWTLPAKITTPSDTVDNDIFHFNNRDVVSFDFHAIICSSDQIGIFTLKTGEAYASGGSQFTNVRQLSVGSGKTQVMTVSHGGISLTGDADDVVYERQKINDPFDLISGIAAFQVAAGKTFAISFQGDGSSAASVTITAYCHGLEPWERA